MSLNAVLVYSKYHFDPINGRQNGGAGFLAATIHKLLNSKLMYSTTLYLDHTELPNVNSRHEKKDLLIGISDNIEIFAKCFRPTHAILFAVNFSALHRRQIYKTAKSLGFSSKFLSWEDGIRSNLNEQSCISAVVTLGGYSNYLSYVNSGMNSRNVFPISCTLGHDFNLNRRRREIFGRDLLYFPGEISFRKGAAFIAPIVTLLHEEGLNRKFRIIGRAVNEELNSLIEQIESKYPMNVVWERKWVERSSEDWMEHVSNTMFAVFPSFEEGIPASVLDLIESEIPVIYSSFCGLDFVSRDVTIASVEIEEWLKLIQLMTSKDNLYFSDLLRRQKLMLENLPKDLCQLEAILARVDSGSIWPQIEISDLLKSDLSKDSWLLKHQGAPKYSVFESSRYFINFLQNEVISEQPLNTEDLIAFAITQLDKFVEQIGVTVFNFNRFITVERMSTFHTQKQFSKTSEIDFELISFISNPRKKRFPQLERFYIKFKDRVMDSIRYRITKFLRLA
jgi:hypothetical protein